MVEKINELLAYAKRCKCIFSHNFFNFAQYPNKNAHLSKLIDIYETMYKTEKYMSSLMCVCKPCLFVIFGLLSTPYIRPIIDANCYASLENNTNLVNKTYDMGEYLQAHSSYDVDPNVYTQMGNAIKVAYHQGVIVLPDPVLVAQTLAMSPHVIMDGIKVIKICKAHDVYKAETVYNSVENALEAYNKFLALFDKDDFYNGYYKENDTTKKYEYFTPTSIDQVHVRIHDLNTNMCQHYNQLVQTQRYLASQGPVSTENIAAKILHSGGGAYLDKSNSSYKSLGEARVYDTLSYALAFATDDDYTRLKTLPPFNGDCIVTSTNILVVDHKGLALFSYKDGAKDTSCSANMRRAIKRPRVPVATTSVANLTRTPPTPHLDRSQLAKEGPVPAISEAAARNAVLLDKHKSEVEKYRKMLNEKKDELAKYFFLFQDDEGVKVDPKAYYPLFDQAMQMYPQDILNTVDSPYSDPMKQSLDISLKDQKYYSADHHALPNTVFVKHLGFITLNRICQQNHLVLKNTQVLLENIMRRRAGVLEFVELNTTGTGKTITPTIPSVQITLNPPAAFNVNRGDAAHIHTLPGPNQMFDKDASFKEEPPNLVECLLPSFDQYNVTHTLQDKCQGLS